MAINTSTSLSDALIHGLRRAAACWLRAIVGHVCRAISPWAFEALRPPALVVPSRGGEQRQCQRQVSRGRGFSAVAGTRWGAVSPAEAPAPHEASSSRGRSVGSVEPPGARQRSGALEGREGEGEGRALTVGRPGLDRPFVILDDPVAHREPETRAGWLGRIERLEEVREVGWGNPGAGVGDDEAEPRRAFGDGPRLDAYVAASRHRLTSIREEVQQDLLERVRIPKDAWKIRVQRPGDLDVVLAQ